MATQCLTRDITAWINRLARLLDRRSAWRLLPLLTGLLFASGRRTVSSWLRAGGLSKDYQDYYYFVWSLGHKVKWLAGIEEDDLHFREQVAPPRTAEQRLALVTTTGEEMQVAIAIVARQVPRHGNEGSGAE